ncbi:MAG: hypothetical protein RLZZ519_3343, partial [Bacteroidota bacterium]
MSESAERQPASNPSSFRKTTAMRTHADHGQFGTPWYASPEVTARVHQPAKPAQVQAKLKVGSAFDPAEAEADNAAREVVSSHGKQSSISGISKGMPSNPPAARIARMPSLPASDRQEREVQAKCKDCEKEGIRRKSASLPNDWMGKGLDLKRKDWYNLHSPKSKFARLDTQKSFTASEATSQRLLGEKNKGQALRNPLKHQMESGFGANFSKIRIHNGPTAQKLNEDLGARAFTHGKDIFFGQGEFEPDAVNGKELIAHELTHTIQQGAAEPVRLPSQVNQNGQETAVSKGKKKTSALQMLPEDQKFKSENEAQHNDAEKAQVELTANPVTAPAVDLQPPQAKLDATTEAPVTKPQSQSSPSVSKSDKGKIRSSSVPTQQGKTPSEEATPKLQPDVLQAVVKEQAGAKEGGGPAEIPVPQLDA